MVGSRLGFFCVSEKPASGRNGRGKPLGLKRDREFGAPGGMPRARPAKIAVLLT